MNSMFRMNLITTLILFIVPYSRPLPLKKISMGLILQTEIKAQALTEDVVFQ